MSIAAVTRCLLAGIVILHAQATATADHRGPTKSPTAKARALLTKARLAKAKQLQRDGLASTTYQRGATTVELSIGPTSDGPLAMWSVRTTSGDTTKEAATVVDAPYPYATTYSETRRLANGDYLFENGRSTRLGYEGVPEADKPVETTLTHTHSRTARNGVKLSVEKTFRLDAPKRGRTLTGNRLRIAGHGALASFDLAAAQPALSGNITALAVEAIGELRDFLRAAAPGLAPAAVAAIATAIEAAPAVAVDNDYKADVRAMWRAAMAGW